MEKNETEKGPGLLLVRSALCSLSLFLSLSLSFFLSHLTFQATTLWVPKALRTPSTMCASFFSFLLFPFLSLPFASLIHFILLPTFFPFSSFSSFSSFSFQSILLPLYVINPNSPCIFRSYSWSASSHGEDCRPHALGNFPRARWHAAGKKKRINKYKEKEKEKRIEGEAQKKIRERRVEERNCHRLCSFHLRAYSLLLFSPFFSFHRFTLRTFFSFSSLYLSIFLYFRSCTTILPGEM